MKTSPAGFSGLGLDEDIIQTLSSLGYEEATPIQREAIPPLLEGRDLLGQAATGTGKTAAFALPLIQAMKGDPERRRGGERIRALILVPTRELAMQVAEALHKYGKSSMPVCCSLWWAVDAPAAGGIEAWVDVVVATPGRALDHIRRGTLDLRNLSTVILDEADEMLDMGFAEDLDAILEATPKERQTALFSATLAPRIKAIAKRHLKDPATVKIEAEKPKQGSIPRVRQVVYMVQRAQKACSEESRY